MSHKIHAHTHNEIEPLVLVYISGHIRLSEYIKTLITNTLKQNFFKLPT